MSGHFIQADQPTVVIDPIRKVVAEAQAMAVTQALTESR